ncbi:MAG: substrate-binding domain-containing protein [Betaproteobacteria bacterium]|nr:substrate-binding domain-containing protein [Betaproteobacteria bacterium]MDH3436975.1 substrate-binding domain-containing protein [Betaproteobacteria bacterium]
MAELKVFATNAIRSVLDELVPPFERKAGHKVSISYNTTAQTLDLINGGATGDLVIATAAGIDEMTKLGKVIPGSRVDLASSVIGVGVRAGAPKPDIRSVDAFKRALLDAKAVAYTSSGLSGVYFAGLIERLGIAEQIKAKARIKPGGLIAEIVVAGEADLAVQMVSELLSVPGAELVGPIPVEINQVTVVAAGILTGANDSGAAKSLIQHLTTPAAARIIRAKGLTPAKNE